HDRARHDPDRRHGVPPEGERGGGRHRDPGGGAGRGVVGAHHGGVLLSSVTRGSSASGGVSGTSGTLPVAADSTDGSTGVPTTRSVEKSVPSGAVAPRPAAPARASRGRGWSRRGLDRGRGGASPEMAARRVEER